MGTLNQPTSQTQPQGLAWPQTPAQEKESPSSPTSLSLQPSWALAGACFESQEPISPRTEARKGLGSGNIPAR